MIYEQRKIVFLRDIFFLCEKLLVCTLKSFFGGFFHKTFICCTRCGKISYVSDNVYYVKNNPSHLEKFEKTKKIKLGPIFAPA